MSVTERKALPFVRANNEMKAFRKYFLASEKHLILCFHQDYTSVTERKAMCQ